MKRVYFSFALILIVLLSQLPERAYSQGPAPQSVQPIEKVSLPSGDVLDGILRFSVQVDPSITMLRVITTLKEGNPIPEGARFSEGFHLPPVRSASAFDPNESYFVNKNTMRIYRRDGDTKVDGKIVTAPWVDTGKFKREANEYFRVTNGLANVVFQLKFGQGHYSVMVYKETNYDRVTGTTTFTGIGKRFTVNNLKDSDPEFLWPSTVVDSDHPEIIKLKDQIIAGKTTDLEKSTAIYEWITKNIEYDIENVFWSKKVYYVASEVAAKKVGSCEGYARLNAALHRAAGIRAKVVSGLAQQNIPAADRNRVEEFSGNHAWNEVELDDPANPGTKKWFVEDATWDAGGVDVPLYQYDSYVRADLEGEKYRTPGGPISVIGSWEFTGKTLSAQLGRSQLGSAKILSGKVNDQSNGGDGLPSSGLGVDGDLFIDVRNGEIYSKASGSWIDTGKNVFGPYGVAGINQVHLFVEANAPQTSLGKGGDLFVNSTTGEVFVRKPREPKFQRSAGKRYFEPDSKRFDQKNFDQTHLKTDDHIYMLLPEEIS